MPRICFILSILFELDFKFAPQLENSRMIANGFFFKPTFPFSSVQFLSRVQPFMIPWTAAHQTSRSITNSQSLLRLMSIKSVMPSDHLILCHPLLLLPSVFPSIRVFSNESVLHIRWPNYWSFSFNISPSNEDPGSPLGWTCWISLQSKGLSRVSSIPQFKSINSLALSFLHSPTLTSIHDKKYHIFD